MTATLPVSVGTADVIPMIAKRITAMRMLGVVVQTM
jgi:hypothetical protein